MLVLSALVFLAVALAVAAVAVWVTPNAGEQRLQALAGTPARDGWNETLVKVAGPLARLTAPRGDWDRSPLRLRFMHAGLRSENAHLAYFTAKTALPLLFALGAFLALRGSVHVQGLDFLFYILLAALIGCYLPNYGLHLLVRRRRREIFESFPDAADLMLVCVEAGLGMDAAMTRVAEEMRLKSVPLAEELHLTNLEMRAGGSREKALHNLALRSGVEEIGVFASMLTQADRFGTSMGDSLRVFSDDLRHKRQVRAEEMAAKVPGKMLFPLVICIFPSIILVMLGPALIQITRTLLPLISGNQ